MSDRDASAWAIRPASSGDRERLLDIWRGAVRATHHFLAAPDLAAIERKVAQDYLPVADLIVAVVDGDWPVGFMGMTGQHIDALFVDPAWHGRGIGRRLVGHGARLHPALSVDVNEQNPGARRFYARLGFEPRGRSALDDAGRPYPLLHLARSAPIAGLSQ